MLATWAAGSVGVEKYDVAGVGCCAVEVLNDLVDDDGERAGRGAAALRHDEPLQESSRRAEGGQGYGVLADGDLVERRHKIEQGEDAPVVQGVEDFVHAGGGELAKGPDGVERLVVGRHPSIAAFLGDGEYGAGVRSTRVLGETAAAARYWSSTVYTGALSAGMEILNGMKEDEPKTVLDVEKTSGKSQRTLPRAVISDGDQPEPWMSNVVSRKWGGGRSQTRRKFARWSLLRRSRSSGQDCFGWVVGRG